MERSCILLGTVDRYIGGHLGISVYQPLCWPMHGQLSTNWIDQREDRVQSFKHRVSTYFWAVLWVRVGFHLNFQVKFICLLFLPSSLLSIIELCSFCHGWKDLFLLQKLDGSHKGYKGCRSDSTGGYTVNADQGGMNQTDLCFCSGFWLPYMYIYVHCYCGAFILSSMPTRLIYFILLSFLAHFCAWRLHP